MFRGPEDEPEWAVSSEDRAARRKGTILLQASGLPPVSFREAFERVFARLTELHAAFTQDGLLAVAVWNGDVVADYLHVPLAGEPEFVTVGRHDCCDLSVHKDPGLSLRHAVIAARARAGELRLRFLDLHSGVGIHTEDGRRCEALAADGAMFVRLGSYQLFLMPTGTLSPLPWGATPDEAWKTIPERVYRDCRVPARQPEVFARSREPQRRQTIITQIVAPPAMLRPMRAALGARGARVAQIRLGTAEGSERFHLHEVDLERGVLVGRYERCQLGAFDDNMSRVHLLIIRDGDETWAVDTASTNGTNVAGEAVRRVPLRDGTELRLANHVSLRWTLDRVPAPPVAA